MNENDHPDSDDSFHPDEDVYTAPNGQDVTFTEVSEASKPRPNTLKAKIEGLDTTRESFKFVVKESCETLRRAQSETQRILGRHEGEHTYGVVGRPPAPVGHYHRDSTSSLESLIASGSRRPGR